MSKNLVLKAGLEEPLLLYSRTRSRAEEHCLIIGHSVVAASLHELVDRSDIIWSCVQDDQAVIETLNECLMRDVTGKLFLDSSTIPPDVTNRIAKQVVEKNAEFVAMPGMFAPSVPS